MVFMSYPESLDMAWKNDCQSLTQKEGNCNEINGLNFDILPALKGETLRRAGSSDSPLFAAVRFDVLGGIADGPDGGGEFLLSQP
jgi:hypothetical protein